MIKNLKGIDLRNRNAFFLILIFTAIVYSNSFSASWHFDDFPNIVTNRGIHISDIGMGSITKALHANPINNSKLIRPVAYLSFAINWYFGKHHVFGYHLINLAIHIIVAFVLFLSILTLLRSPNVSVAYKGDEYFIALLASVLWSIHPIQVQAVTYIVQRMASMASLFYILGIFLYLKARIAKSKLKACLLVFGIVISYFLAILTKENTVTLPIAILLLEFLFYQDKVKTLKRIRENGVFSVFIAILLVVIFYKIEWSSIISGYENRPFTFAERMLTEPRIVLFYLKQLLIPINSHLSIVHDVKISTSLFHPIMTLPSMLCILGLLGIGISQIKGRPFVALAILFYFLNQIIESSIIPLELIFEHRNYLPSMFLFVPIAAGIKALTDFYYKKQLIVAIIVVISTTLAICGIGLATYTRNQTWSTEESLWMDAMYKAPNNPRPYQNIAGIYKDRGHYERSMALYQKAVGLPNVSDISISKSKNNIGNIYWLFNDSQNAMRFYREAVAIDEGNRLARINLASELIRVGDYALAMQEVDKLLAIDQSDVRHINLKGFILYKRNYFDKAIMWYKKGLSIDPSDRNFLINISMAISRTGAYRNANFFLSKALLKYPKDIYIYFALIDSLYNESDKLKLENILDRLFSTFSINNIIDQLNNAKKMENSTPFRPDLTAKIIANKIERYKNEE